MGSVPSSLDGAAVTFTDEGQGEPALVFIHGLMGDRSDFDHQLHHFAASRRAVAIDLPGLATPAADRKEWTMAAFGEDVATVVEHLDLGSVVLVGHSLGGDVTVEAARRLRDRVVGLVWISSYRKLGSPVSEASIAAWLEPFRSDFGSAMDALARRNFGPDADPRLIQKVVARGERMDPTTVLAALASKLHNEAAVSTGIDELGLPIVAINGSFKPNDRASFAAHGVDLVVVPGVGHFVMLEDPDAFDRHLEDAIDGMVE